LRIGIHSSKIINAEFLEGESAMADKTDQLELAQMIQSLRAELTKAQKAGTEEEIRFTVEDVELELEIIAKEAIEGGIAAKFYVLTSQYKASKDDAVTQKIKLRLKPADSSGNPIAVSDKETLPFNDG
jgi:hypothetical protein